MGRVRSPALEHLHLGMLRKQQFKKKKVNRESANNAKGLKPIIQD